MGPGLTQPTALTEPTGPTVVTGLTMDSDALYIVFLKGGRGGPAAVYTSIGSRLMLDLIREEVIATGGLGANNPLIAVPR